MRCVSIADLRQPVAPEWFEQSHRPEVSAGQDFSQILPHKFVELNPPKVARQKLQTCIRSQSRFSEFQLQIGIDATVKIRFLSSHKMWPFVEGIGAVEHFPRTPTGGFFK